MQLANQLNELLVQDYRAGQYAEAIELGERALAIYEAQLGPDHPSTASSLNNLAQLYQAMGRYEEAALLSSRALTIWEAELGPDHPSTAVSLNNLAQLYQSMGRYQEAEPLFARALAILEEELGLDHPDTAVSLNNLAMLYESLGRNEEAEPLFARALAIREEQLGSDHPDTAGSLNNLAMLYESLGRYEEAESLYSRALAIKEEQLGPDHPDTAVSLNNLALLYESLGRYEEVEPLFARALAIREEQLGSDHPDTASSLNNLAYLYQALGRYEEAGQLGAKCTSIRTQNLRRVLNYFTEAECLAYAKKRHPYNLAGLLEAPALAARAQLQTKGLVMEAMGYRRRLESELADDPQGLALLGEREKLAPTYQKLLLQEGEAAEATQKLKKRITDLDKQINLRLQGDSGEALELVPSQVELAEVQAGLPEGVRLLQGFRYHHRLKENRGFEQRYAWTVVWPESTKPSFVALGSAEEIDDAIATYRAFFARRQDPSTLPQALSRLYQLLWEPLEKAGALENVNTVVISGDAQLHFLPFGTLIQPGSETPRFLCQDYAIRYVNSGRDLVKQPRESSTEETRSALVVGNPSSDWKEMLVASVEDERLSRNLNLGMDEDTLGMFFAPLPGTKWESELLDEMLSSSGYAVKSLSESDATESALRAAIERPDILHLATHGFFLREPKQDSLPEERRGLQVQFANASSTASPAFDLRRVQDPMLRSGLALTGAQNTIDAWQKRETPDPDNDGLLLAAEAAGLDLRGTKLVVMSACSTGEGRAMDGEGVMGLRRALAVAGAETVVMSMWPVDDAATVEFMERFYKRHLHGMHPAQALDETRRELLVERVESEGLYKAIQRYGPFIATSIGPVVPGNPKATDPSVVVAQPDLNVGNGETENIGLNVILGLTLALFVLGIVQRFQRA